MSVQKRIEKPRREEGLIRPINSNSEPEPARMPALPDKNRCHLSNNSLTPKSKSGLFAATDESAERGTQRHAS